MAYIGQEPGQGQAERFIYTATGSGTVVSNDDDNRTIGYTLHQVSVYLNGVKQVIGTGKDVVASDGSTVVFASAYASGDVIEVIALSAFSASDTVSASTGGTFSGVVTAPSLVITPGTAPATTEGAIYYNTTTKKVQVYNGTSWVSLNDTYTTIEYLVVAGAGGGGSGGYMGGGGGAGGILSGSSLTLTDGTPYTCTIGAGGIPVNGSTSVGDGGISTISGSDIPTITAIGGGAGGSNYGVATGRTGGSGGGGGESNVGGAGTSGQGNAGGSGGAGDSTTGGGGGKGAAGGNKTGGAGSNTWSTWATATSSGDGGYYGGGGGGSVWSGGGSAGTGGAGGGANGVTAANNGVNGDANTGGGGSGSSQTNGSNVGQGGSGIIIIRYVGTTSATGGTIVESGGYTYHKFTGLGTFTLS